MELYKKRGEKDGKKRVEWEPEEVVGRMREAEEVLIKKTGGGRRGPVWEYIPVEKREADSQAEEKVLPAEINPKDMPHEWGEDKFKQEQLERPPIRALAIKGRQLREAIRGGNLIEWGEIHERFVDLWQEARLVIWRAKHRKKGTREYDPVVGKVVATYVPDDRMVLEAIGTVKGLLDSMMRLRKEMGSSRSGVPRWAIERIERGLRNYPEAQQALLKELMAEQDEPEEKE